MKTKETTPPSQRTFSIELNEDELRILTILVGHSTSSYFKEAYLEAHSMVAPNCNLEEKVRGSSEISSNMYVALKELLLGEVK